MLEQSTTILNVDDNEIARYAITRLLRSAGFEVIEASTGRECLEIAARNHPDLIILDVQLPDINGFDVCRQLKTDQDTADIAVLHLSASFINSLDTAYGLEEGADGYLTQPVEPPVLIGHIKALLRMRLAEHEARERAVQWQTTFDAISDAIFLVDKSGHILQCNQAMANLIGRPVGEIRGRLLTDISRTQRAFPIPDIDILNLRQNDDIRIGDHWFLITTDTTHGSSELNGKVYALTDITKRKRAEEENVRLLHETQQASLQQRTFMRDMLSSVTDGKLRLCDTASDLPPTLATPGIVMQLDLGNLRALRTAVQEALIELDFPEERIANIIAGVHEAGSNAIVHAGGGTLSIFSDKPSGKIQFWIEDAGNGIEVERLPSATLQRGYSTAGTFGHGFKIVIYEADLVWLLTGRTGTTVVVEENR